MKGSYSEEYNSMTIIRLSLLLAMDVINEVTSIVISWSNGLMVVKIGYSITSSWSSSYPCASFEDLLHLPPLQHPHRYSGKIAQIVVPRL